MSAYDYLVSAVILILPKYWAEMRLVIIHLDIIAYPSKLSLAPSCFYKASPASHNDDS